MSNVYSVGNNRQLIIYNAGSNIFLRVAHFGGLDRPIVLAADYLCGLTECIYNSSLYYSYINQNGSLILKNIMDTANVLAIDCNYVQEYSNPKLSLPYVMTPCFFSILSKILYLINPACTV